MGRLHVDENLQPARLKQKGTFSMRVLVMNDTGRPATRLKEWLQRYDFNVIAELGSHHHLAQRVCEMLPDAIIVDTSSPSPQMLEQIVQVNTRHPRPILLFSKDGRNEMIKTAIRRGVTSYMVGNVNLERLPVIMRVAQARFEEDRDRRKELDDLKSELHQLKAVTRAKAIIMKVKHCSEEEAHRSLSEIALSRNMPIGAIAEQVVEMAKLLGND